MKEYLKSVYIRQQFSPTWIGIVVNPFYLARAGLSGAVREFSGSLSGRLLDVGCGTKPYEAFFSVSEYVGLDIDSSISRGRDVADYFYKGHEFPFDPGEFDAVLCNQVLEHVFNPDEFLSEIARVLGTGGKLLLTVPFVWDEHEQPFDYARYSSFGLNALLENSGFKILVHKKLCADASILAQLANAYIYKVSQRMPPIWQHGLTVSVMAMLNVLGLIARRILPANPDLYLDHVVLAEKVQ